MRRVGTMLLMCLCLTGIFAQHNMRIHYKSGMHTDIAIAGIDSITFVDKIDADANNDELVEDATIIGSWLWGDQEAGYYEMLTFNDDHTYTGYDYYFTYGFDTQTYGWYSYNGAMLTLQSNGVGYRRRYNWYVTTLTNNALEVMTRMGAFTYYKLQPEEIYMLIGSSVPCQTDEEFIFADGVVAKVDEKNLCGISSGLTYILKKVSDTILAYKVIVK